MLAIEKFSQLDKPVIVIEKSLVKENIQLFQDHCKWAGINLRPQIKTHKMVKFAKVQADAGAAGINCQKIGEAGVMAKADLNDIFITFNILGKEKLRRLVNLGNQLDSLTVTVDSVLVVNGLSEVFVSQKNHWIFWSNALLAQVDVGYRPLTRR